MTGNHVGLVKPSLTIAYNIAGIVIYMSCFGVCPSCVGHRKDVRFYKESSDMISIFEESKIVCFTATCGPQAREPLKGPFEIHS
jgi:hypothetical protein